MKKTIIISISVLALIALLWFLFSKTTKNGQVVSRISTLFPIGNNINVGGGGPVSTTIPIGGTGAQMATSTDSERVFRQIFDHSIGGADLVKLGGTSTLGIVERSSGNIFRYDPTKGLLEKLTITTLPGIVESYWLEGKDSPRVLLRQDQTDFVANYLGLIKITKVGTSTMVGELINSPLPLESYSFSLSPQHDKLVYLAKNGRQSVIISSDNTMTLNKELGSLPLTDWIIHWVNPSVVALQTRASELTPGRLFFFEGKSGLMTKVLNDVPGLAVKISPDGTKILYSDDQANLFLYDLTKRTNNPISLKTLADKCTWSRSGKIIVCGVPDKLPGGEYPADWYKGLMHFSDAFWSIDPKTNKLTFLFNPDNARDKVKFDTVGLLIDETNQQAYLTNKNDRTLWALSLSGKNLPIPMLATSSPVN